MVAPPPSPLRIVEIPVLSTRGERFTHTIAVDDRGSGTESLSTTKDSDDNSYQYKLKKNIKSTSLVILDHMKHHVGPGILASIAYFDPGNWAVDLQAGSQFGYKLLFVVLLAGLGAVLLQTMAARLGCVTGRDLAEHCRILLYNRPKHTLLYRRLLLYPMYVICEIGIIATDLAELLGSAIGLTLLIPSLPLWASVVITSFDVIFVLAIAPSSNGRPIILMILVFVVFGSFIVLLVKIKPDAGDVIIGYLPSKARLSSALELDCVLISRFQTLFQSGALYTSIGILGATVMPHAIFLGSSLATLDRVSPAPSPVDLPAPSTNQEPTNFWQKLTKLRKAMIYIERKPTGNPLMSTRANQSSSVEPKESETASVSSHSKDDELVSPTGRNYSVASRKHLNNPVDFISAHLGHAIIDIVMSLLGFAVVINSAILILAAAAFFYSGTSVADAGLFDAYDLIKQIIGKPAATMFAVALLCSGQSASITATLAGQIVSEGFIEWRVSPLVRRVITRLIGLVPSTVVAITVGRQGIDILLVASQVALSIVLPFVIFPLVYLTSQESIMQVAKPEGGTVSYKSNISPTSKPPGLPYRVAYWPTNGPSSSRDDDLGLEDLNFPTTPGAIDE
ncbi:unnamed protein product [Rhizoctonia solani]|uniref:Manganese transporter pdt1 [Schizosaccharomyces pombe 972h-] n=1 Tax=Rhizoctonia solani TaxID=456999 RepID=A0A8H3GJF9_9AGAM|nr:unnamed protein product [Rhizoctonia solani]